MDCDLLDRWLNCVYGVDCATHRLALEEIQQLRKDLAAADDLVCLKGDLDHVTAERDALQVKLNSIARLAA
jgi:hypothetical protein